MTYYAARLSFFPAVQKILSSSKKSDKMPIKLAERLIIESDGVYNAPKRKGHTERGFLDFSLAEILTDDDSNLIAFKLCPRKLTRYNDVKNKKLKRLEFEDHPDSNVVWVAKEQLIFVEKPKKYNVNMESILASFADYLNKMLRDYELEVNIIPITNESMFWDVIGTGKKIYEVEFSLIAPNFIGGFNHNIREILQGSKDLYNSSKTTFGISNNDGDLRISQEDPAVVGMLLWVADGGGNWRIKTLSGRRKTEKTSAEGPVKVDADLEEYDTISIHAFVERALSILKSLKGKEKK